MSFAELLKEWPASRVRSLIAQASAHDIDRVLADGARSPQDLAALLSPKAAAKLEALAQKAHHISRQQFGRVINLYAPVYLSNICQCDCLYCSCAARSGHKEKRVSLDAQAQMREFEALAKRGFRHVLLLTGEAPQAAPVSYIAEAVSRARAVFPSVSVEVYSLSQEGYAALVDAGLEGVTLYMETYDQDIYAKVHPRGIKRDYQYRLDSLDRAGLAGVRRLGLGALLGLSDWHTDGFYTGLHARYLQKTCWQSAVSVSIPRLRHVPERFAIPEPMTDPELVQYLLALRLFLPQAGLTLSTREPGALRDKLIALGITAMSAGSSTRPGGYSLVQQNTLGQFDIEDARSPESVAQAIRDAGYEPVWKDFDFAF